MWAILANILCNSNKVVSKSFRTGRLKQELQMVKLCLVRFAAIILCVASQRVFIVVFISFSTPSGNFGIHPRKLILLLQSIFIGILGSLELSQRNEIWIDRLTTQTVTLSLCLIKQHVMKT